MNRKAVLGVLLGGLTAVAISADAQNFAGEYADRNFLNGQATFQMSLEQSGNTVSVWFSAGYNDGHTTDSAVIARTCAMAVACRRTPARPARSSCPMANAAIANT